MLPFSYKILRINGYEYWARKRIKLHGQRVSVYLLFDNSPHCNVEPAPKLDAWNVCNSPGNTLTVPNRCPVSTYKSAIPLTHTAQLIEGICCVLALICMFVISMSHVGQGEQQN